MENSKNPQLPGGNEGCIVKNGFFCVTLAYGIEFKNKPVTDYASVEKYAAEKGFSFDRGSSTIRRTMFVPAKNLPDMNFIGIYLEKWQELFEDLQSNTGKYEFKLCDGDCYVGEDFDKVDTAAVMTDEQVARYIYKKGKCRFNSNGAYEGGKFDGKTCTVICPLTATEIDIFETGQMYSVVMEDGTKHDVFDDEITML